MTNRRGDRRNRYPQSRDLRARAAVRRPQFRLHPGAVRAVPESARVGRPGLARPLRAHPREARVEPGRPASPRALPWRRERRQRSSCRRRGGRAPAAAPRCGRGRDGARQGASHARPPCRAPRPARQRASRRSGARARAPRAPAHSRAPGPGARTGPARPRPRRDAGRCPPASPRDVLRDDGLRDRAHLEARGARVASDGDRVGPVPHASRRGRAAHAAPEADRGRGDGALSAAMRSSARSSSPSKGSTRWSRCSTRRSSSPRRTAPTTSSSAWRTADG